MKEYRIGLGIDVHRFTKKRKNLILGGILIPSSFGIEAISDGDLILHSLSDAICGAARIGDIGDYFPPSKKYKDLDSKKIVNFILKKIEKKFSIVNMDITLISEKPKLAPYKKKILKSLKKIFKVSCINLKIKSKEGLDFLGGKNSISCLSVVLLKKC
jgi:2-C-methyl-D-erythritol 2,4-cyclodiphosphate synthase